MFKFISVLAVAGLLLLGASSLAGAASGGNGSSGQSGNALTVVAVLGPSVTVQPNNHFGLSQANCPRGYYVTGGGDYNGALTVIASGPTGNLRGWFVDDQNTTGSPATGPAKTYTHRADAICVKGSKAVSIGTPPISKKALDQLQAEAAASRR